MPVIEHIPVIKHMPVIEAMSVLEGKNSLTGGGNIWSLRKVIVELHIGKRRPFKFIISFVQSLLSCIPYYVSLNPFCFVVLSPLFILLWLS